MPIERIRTFLPEESLVSKQNAARLPAGPTKRLIHAARLSEDKGSFLVVDVCARLNEANVPFSAEIIGAADEETLYRLKQKIRASGLENKITLHEQMLVPDLLDRIRAADFLVHLSKLDSYPLIVLEALTCSALPICRDLPGARHMVETYDGFVVGSARSDEEAADIIAAIDVEEARIRAHRAARRVVADYDWADAGEALENALEAT